jgi:hypothetical protein
LEKIEREKKIKLKDNNKKNYLIFSEKQNRYDYYEKKELSWRQLMRKQYCHKA